MISLNHFYIDTDYLLVNHMHICKLNKQCSDVAYDIRIPHSEFRNVLIPFDNILDTGEYKNGIPVSTWGNDIDPDDDFCVEFTLADDVFIVLYEAVKLIRDVSDISEYEPLERFAS